MPTDYEYALFSLDAYQNATDNVVLPAGWSTYRTSDSFGLSASGYYGIAYINETTKEIVIANRGTEPSDTGDIESDLQISPAGRGFLTPFPHSCHLGRNTVLS